MRIYIQSPRVSGSTDGSVRTAHDHLERTGANHPMFAGLSTPRDNLGTPNALLSGLSAESACYALIGTGDLARA